MAIIDKNGVRRSIREMVYGRKAYHYVADGTGKTLCGIPHAQLMRRGRRQITWQTPMCLNCRKVLGKRSPAWAALRQAYRDNKAAAATARAA